MRFKLTLEYDGAPFQGWQRLGEGASVQAALEGAVEKLTGEASEVVAAGRTDAGVHARGQIAHVDIAKPFPAWKLADALNAHLRPAPISVIAAAEAGDQFHARFDAINRVYLYRIINRRAPLTLERGQAWRVGAALDARSMREAALGLIGKHDFTTFRDAQCQAKSPIKTLDRCDVVRLSGKLGGELGGELKGEPGDEPGGQLEDQLGDEIQIWCEARSFLHRQVRSMVGTLAEVGMGKMTAADVAAALAAKDRARCGPVAPADGLYLMRVDYPK